jgi:hypothetical protein
METCYVNRKEFLSAQIMYLIDLVTTQQILVESLLYTRLCSWGWGCDAEDRDVSVLTRAHIQRDSRQ